MISNATRINLDELNDWLFRGATVITANRRLSRELHEQFRREQQDSGELAWETPDILPMESWLERLWGELSVLDESGPDCWVLLSKLQTQEVWRKVISDDINLYESHTQPLWSVDATVKSAMHAWEILNQWNIDAGECARSLLEDHRRFSRWVEHYSATCQEKSWADPFQLEERITGGLQEGQAQLELSLVLAGFHELSPRKKALFQQLQEQGCQLGIYNAEKSAHPVSSFHEFLDEYSQWLAAAKWAREHMTQNPRARLAVIVPTLSRSRTLIEHAFNQILCPARLAQLDTTERLPYHVSLGPNLDQYPVIKSALRLLSLIATNTILSSQVRSLILDPFIRGASQEKNHRAILEQACRRRLPYALITDKLQGYLESHKEYALSPMLADVIVSLGLQLEKANGKKNYSDWSDQFAQWLESCGWPGDEILDSEQHQVIEALHKQVTALRTLDAVSGQVKLNTALSRLRSRLAQQPFQVESTGSRLEILGVSESSGIEFDAIWFAGMNENEWPPPLDTSPFIPLNLQRDSGYHGACLENNLAYTAMIQKQLSHQADEIIFTRASFDKEVSLYPGPLFEHSPVGSNYALSVPRSLIRQMQACVPEMEHYCDTDSIPLSTSSPKGGIRIIEDQAACPFRAFARHRLGADDRDPRQQGLDPSDRGKLVHNVLEAFWKQVKSSEQLRELGDQELDQLLADCTMAQTLKFHRTSGVKSGFFTAQSEWLVKLLKEWLAIEGHRRLEFLVVATEQAVVLELEGLELSLQIDRIDELEDGSIALIDYKTGQAHSVTSWVGERPGYPQLALYSLALYNNLRSIETRDLSALLVGQLRIGESRYSGFVLGDSFYDDTYSGRQVPTLEKTRIDEDLKSWPAIYSHWNVALGDLARQFRQGHAQVDPINESACGNCNLHTLCRIFEQSLGFGSDHSQNQGEGS